jgi:hypothetical protein
MSETTNDGHNVNVASTGLSLWATEKRNSFWPPVGTKACHPRNFRRKGCGARIFENQLSGAFLDNSTGLLH